MAGVPTQLNSVLVLLWHQQNRPNTNAVFRLFKRFQHSNTTTGHQDTSAPGDAGTHSRGGDAGSELSRQASGGATTTYRGFLSTYCKKKPRELS